MLDKNRIQIIEQKRMDALSAKHLHESRLADLNRLIFFVDLLAFGVPMIYFPIRFLAKGTTVGSIIEPVWELLSALLLFLAATKLIGGWQSKAEKHSKLIGENISLSSQAEQIINNSNVATADSVQMFVLLADLLEKSDREALGTITDDKRKWAYRQGLKELSPGTTRLCPECNASPWHYLPGSCQLCGNTPIAASDTPSIEKEISNE